jgi:diguanylate cyclase (GGDEF)-like protein
MAAAETASFSYPPGRRAKETRIPMSQDVNKHLEKARRSLEKNKLREAVAEYQAALDESPSHPEALQALADIYTRLNEPAMAAQYYGAQFDRLIDVGDAAKASAVFSRFLRPFPQPPDRLMRYATLLQKQNRISEAIEQFGAAVDIFHQHHRDIEALACCESIALLDPENPQRHAALAELAEELRHADLAARSFLRAGQLTLATGGLDLAVEYFERAHRLIPEDRTCALLFAEAKLRKGDAEGAVALLEPFSPNEKDTAFLALFGEGLLRTGRLDHARDVFEAYYKQKPDSFGKLFEVAGGYIKGGEDQKGAGLLKQIKESMCRARKETELVIQMDRLAATYSSSLPLAQEVATIYEALNREAKYFDALMHLFDLYFVAGHIKEACDVLDRLVDIDPYDYRNQERISKLEGKVDPAFLQNILARAAKAATVSTRTDGFSGAGSGEVAAPATEEGRVQQALEDLIVQVEIFLQYSLQAKAVERLERLAQLFPGEEERNERLRALYERANWWPKGTPLKTASTTAPPAPTPPARASAPEEPVAPAPVVAPTAEETNRDLAAIGEINRLMYRQATPREVLETTAAQIGKHLGVTRCLVAVGGIAEAAQLVAEYSAPGIEAAGSPRISSLAATISHASPDALGAIGLDPSGTPGLQELGLESALAVVLTDKDATAPAGALLVGDSTQRKWKPNESFFLQAVGDQLMMAVSHTRLRSLMRTLAVADERTGLLSRGSYVDCLLSESNRARTQGTPLSLVILQVDHGSDLLKQHGDAAVEPYFDQLARALCSSIRQTDIAVKYTAWSIVIILPDTSLDNARVLADKLRQIAATIQPAWASQGLTVSAVVAQATSRQTDDVEDRVTEWMNRAEAGLEEVRQHGGDVVIPLATP